MQSDESCKRHDPWVSVRLVVRIAGRILVALRVDAQQIDDTELGGDPNVVAAIFRLARVGRNKRSALRRMGTDATCIAGSRRITLR
jgi:hypothetical protein